MSAGRCNVLRLVLTACHDRCSHRIAGSIHHMEWPSSYLLREARVLVLTANLWLISCRYTYIKSQYGKPFNNYMVTHGRSGHLLNNGRVSALLFQGASSASKRPIFSAFPIQESGQIRESLTPLGSTGPSLFLPHLSVSWTSTPSHGDGSTQWLRSA